MKINLIPTKGPKIIGLTFGVAFAIALVAWAPPTIAQPAASGPGSGAVSHKPRIIVTTDLGADPDDEQSLVRLLVSANEFDIEGLIVSTGCWKKNQSNTANGTPSLYAYHRVIINVN